MKLLIFAFLTPFFILLNFSEYSDNRSIIIVSGEYSNRDCKRIAFRISNEKIEIDTCYNFENNIFNTTKIVELNDELIVKKISNIPTEKLKSYQAEIDSTIYATPCDYLLFPISIIITEEEKETTVEWKRTGNCCRQEIREKIEELEKVFDKYK
ncbi:hypothetical protein [Bernardetia sp.]|uniref:hypothetical protein n=1 Tax=Bernardetia sp. TaxID=1937974 RepID=UPI0025BF31B7|nr:hypothetical protein [Bernardetia sp.]